MDKISRIILMSPPVKCNSGKATQCWQKSDTYIYKENFTH